MDRPLLEGSVDNRDTLIESLQEQIVDLKRELRTAQADVAQAKKSNAHAIKELRNVVEPMFNALALVMGKIEAIPGVESSAPATDSRQAAVWQSWKSRVGVTGAKIIDALLLHGEKNTTQLAILCGLSRRTIPQGIFALNKAGLIIKNGSNFSLKEL